MQDIERLQPVRAFHSATCLSGCNPANAPRPERCTNYGVKRLHVHALEWTGPCARRGMRVIDLIQRLRDEYTEMPGLRLTTAQVERLGDCDASTSVSALHALVSAGFLKPLPDGHFGRADLVSHAPGNPSIDQGPAVTPSPWRRLLCLVDRDSDSGNGLSAAARSVLRYATTLAVTHRARITALQVIPAPVSGAAHALATDELRGSVSAERFRELIDVHVATGSPDEEVARVANDILADLIVIGRSGRHGELLPRFSGTLRQAPCPVLIVHPSGRAAVA
jgi:nucleotide-binding universal stress UspA family protein